MLSNVGIKQRLILAIALAPMLISAADADDWPQWMGPRRDNVWREEGVIERFPAAGPKILWRTPIAGGYAGPAVAEGGVFVMDYVTSQNVKIDNFDRKTAFTGVERVLRLDAETGEIKWKHEYPVTYTMSYPAGPRCTPTVADGKVYALGAEGNLWCLDATSGDVIWSKDFHADYDAKTATWGYASHPLVDGDKLICVVGGERSHAVAFDKNTGEEKWRALSAPEQGYCPPTIVEAGGVRQLLLMRPIAISSVNPETGNEYWSVPYEATMGSIIMSPVRWGDYVYAGGFNNKSLLLKLGHDKPTAEIVWRDRSKDAISAVNVQPFAEDGVLYGFDQGGTLRALELATGKKLWETTEPVGGRPANSGTAFIVRQGGRYWMFVETGDLVIARLTRDGFQELDRAHVIEPAFANRRAHIRNDKECICVDLAAR
jgi:outer membrane protein assembly factor BamB